MTADSRDTADTQRKHSGLIPFKPGQSGNPAGRPKGARSKLGEEFLKTLLADYAEHGAAAVAIVRETKPADYLKVVASILPKEFELGDETIDVLSTLLGRIDGRTRSVLPPDPFAPTMGPHVLVDMDARH